MEPIYDRNAVRETPSGEVVVVRSPCLLAASIIPVLLAAGEDHRLQVLTHFPGGSITVEGVDQERRIVRVAPAYPHRGTPLWWCFKLEGVRLDEVVTIDLGRSPFTELERSLVGIDPGLWVTPDRVALSQDGRTWNQSNPGAAVGNRVVYRQKIDGNEAWFAWGPPYQLKDAAEAVGKAAENSPFAQAFELAKTGEGRSVPALQVSEAGRTAGEPYGVWVQARQHAFEAGGSWVAQGFLEWVVSGDPRAQDLRKWAVIVVAPVIDADSVEAGQSGKNQPPQDHNRDWSEKPYWPEVRAAQKAIRDMDARGRFDLYVDVHNPSPRDRGTLFLVPAKKYLSERGKRNLDGFLAAARTDMTGPLGFSGTVREYDRAVRDLAKMSINWIADQTRDHVVAVTVETSWNTVHSTIAGYKDAGRKLGLAIERYLRGPVRE